MAGYPLGGEIRFRLTAHNDPALFDSGTDLLGPSGEPWGIPLVTVLNFSRYKALKEQLELDKLLDQDLKLICDTPPLISRRSRVLYTLEQPFYLDLAARNFELRLVLSNSVGRIRVNNTFYDHREHICCCPYTGRILVRFERCTPPQHTGTNSIALRVLKVIEPISTVKPDYDMRLPIPTEGRLLEKPRYNRSAPIVFDLNKLPNAMKDLRAFLNPSLPLIPIKQYKRCTRRPAVQSLDPRRLVPSDFIDISNALHVHVPITSSTNLVCLTPTSHRFPPRTHGFLYYHQDPSLPATAGEVRLRLTASNDPALFQSGTDLANRYGHPWAISLPQLLDSGRAPLKERLILDKLVEPDFIRSLEISWINRPRAHANIQCLHRLEDSFEVPLNHSLRLRLITPHSIGVLFLPYIFKTNEQLEGYLPVYTGRTKLGFERSSLKEHLGTDTIVLRVLKITEPIQPLRPNSEMCLPMPREGALLQRMNQKTGRVYPYSLDLNNLPTEAKALKSFARSVAQDVFNNQKLMLLLAAQKYDRRIGQKWGTRVVVEHRGI
ncbi:hypothetical protein H0H81_011358 [Sphagnurus paluster]|uniref:Uncharacterized protein n=1 Tax=Sphagnurus paluster TaxID=117069 RepID=A0A9P7K706_9AGAR|nr:hypothetical protein H0H81_011358 [Sphagnurus paluster]